MERGVKVEGAAAYVPQTADLDVLAAEVQSCHGCELHRDATQAVFGAGPPDARVMIVGETPGDREDLAGEPFVGPAGGLLNRALEESGIDRAGVYVTNAVKHFKFTVPERGKRRIHQKPSRTEVVACRPWLYAELGVLEPELVVCLGATAAQSLLGTSFRVSKQRGEPITAELGEPPRATTVLATVHPSSVLRARDEDRKQAYTAFVDDLRAAAKAMR